MNHWNTLGVADLQVAAAFYESIGFTVHSGPPNVPCIVVSPVPEVTICLFERSAFTNMTFGPPLDPMAAQELVQTLGVDDRATVDRLVEAARAGGAREVRPPSLQPWGYGGGFQDPDGHAWAVICYVSE